jgi:hypothetical protein
VPELLRFSSANHLLSIIPEDLQAHHRVVAPVFIDMGRREMSARFIVANKARNKGIVQVPPPKRAESLWDGWEDAQPGTLGRAMASEGDSDGELDLEAYGL